jgi:DNA-binding response OmpR family regulator
MNILHIEDDLEVAKWVKQLLLDHAITLATDGHEGVKMAQDGNYDFIICDFNLPGLNGCEIIQELRSMGIETPVIANSLNNDSNKYMRQAGAVTFLRKIRSADDVNEETRSHWEYVIKRSL